MEKKAFDVIVIGGGLSGLAAAVKLAQEGKCVAVLEKAKNLGGRASTKEMGGSLYNLGPHAFYKNGRAVAVLNELGIKLNGNPPAKQGKVIYQGEAFDLPTSMMSMLKTKLLSWKEKKEFAKVMLNMNKLNPDLYLHQSLEQWVEENIESPLNQSLFYMFSRLTSYIHAPHLVTAGIVLIQLKLSLGGTIYVHRGWQAIINQLEEKATRLGVSLLKESHIEELSVNQELKTVTFSNGNEQIQITSPWIISTIPPQELLRLVKGLRDSPAGKIIENYLPVKASCLDVTLNHLPKPNQHFALDLDQPLYYSNHSAAAKLTYHPGHQVIHVMKYLAPNEPAGDVEQLDEFLEKNQPHWRDYVVNQRFLPHLTVSYKLPTVGAEDITSRILEEYPGLFLAGEWTSDKHILAEAALDTAFAAANKILKERRVKINV